MFEKFGKMDYGELIRTARAEREEGDAEALTALVLENGLDREDAEDYLDGIDDALGEFAVAGARLNGEARELDASGIWEDWKNLLLELCQRDREFCVAVCRKDRELTALYGKILKEGFDSKRQVDKRIAKAAGLNDNIYIGLPSKRDVIRIARAYYGEG